MRKWSILFMIFINFLQAHGEDVELKNLRWDWVVYDEKVDQLVPYFNLPNAKSAQFELDLNTYRDAYFKLACPSGYFLWIANNLVYQSDGAIIYYDLDSLKNQYAKSKIDVTLYSDNFNALEVTTKVVKKNVGQVRASEEALLPERDESSKRDRFIIISVITLALIAIFRTFNFRLFREYFSIGKSVQIRQNFDLITAHSPLAWPNIGFIGFYAILVANAFLNFEIFSNEEVALKDGLKIASACFALMIIKFLLIYLGSELFKIKKVRLVHFFTYFRLSLIMALFAFCLSLFNGILDGQIINGHGNSMQIILCLLWSIRLILIFFVLNKIYTFRKLHLFSYLCSSELIPLLLFFKAFLK